MFRAIIENGRMVFGSPIARSKFVDWATGHEGAHIVINEEKRVRSLSQNAFYWVYLGVIARETGDNADDLHEFFKRKLLSPVFKSIHGEEIRLPRSTTELSKVDLESTSTKPAHLLTSRCLIPRRRGTSHITDL